MDQEEPLSMIENQKKKVSIVIPTKNAENTISDLIITLLDQKTPWLFEILVIDSGSRDNTVDIIKSFPSVKLIEIPPSDFGHGKTRNFGIKNTTGDFIAILTQDAIPINNCWLENFVASINQDERIAGVFGRHIANKIASPFTRNELEQHFDGFLNEPIVGLDDRKRYQIDEGYRKFLYFFSDNNALIRRSVWEKFPYPEVDFAEDQAWAKVIIEAGYLKAYSSDAVVYHSHDYGFFERLQRSFDETYALRRLFGYKHGYGLKGLIKSFIGMTYRDINISFRNNLFISDFKYVIRMPLDHFMRSIGTYLGSKAEHLPSFIRNKLSRDKNLMLGTNIK